MGTKSLSPLPGRMHAQGSAGHVLPVQQDLVHRALGMLGTTKAHGHWSIRTAVLFPWVGHYRLRAKLDSDKGLGHHFCPRSLDNTEGSSWTKLVRVTGTGRGLRTLGDIKESQSRQASLSSPTPWHSFGSCPALPLWGPPLVSVGAQALSEGEETEGVYPGRADPLPFLFESGPAP